MTLAPIILFVYNRPDMAEATLLSLKQNELANESELFIYSDGPKADTSPEQLNKIKKVREIIRRENWCAKVNIIEREKNVGLADSVTGGVTETVNKYGKVIVVEDDVKLSPFFLRYMNDALNAYENNEKIIAIGSWNYFASDAGFTSDHFLFRYPDSIAWATYKRSWSLFEHDAKAVYSKLKSKNKLKAFNGNGHAAYFENMLQMQIDKKINSWAIRWTASAVLHDKLTVLPKISMSKHMGSGAEATHEKSEVDYNADLVVSDRRMNIAALSDVTESKMALEKWTAYVKTNFATEPERPKAIGFRLKRKIKSIIKRFL